MKTIPAGTTYNQIFHPGKDHYASATGNHGVDVVATTALILFFEETCGNLASDYFDKHEVSVGTRVVVDHLAPAHADESVQVTATLKHQQGRRLEFVLTASQGNTIVMTGEHHRAVVDRARFSAPSAHAPDDIQNLEFWFDFHSPWCYFASFQIGSIGEEFDLPVIWRPVHLANLMDAVDGRRPLESNSRFLAWYFQDQRDTANLLGLPYERHADYPKRPSRALRAAIFADDQGLVEPFVKAVMKGYWSEQKDISDLAWLEKMGDSVGLNGVDLIDAATNREYKTRLNQNLAQAVDKNLFGLPTILAGGKMFFGQDRLDHLRHHLSGVVPRLGIQKPPK